MDLNSLGATASIFVAVVVLLDQLSLGRPIRNWTRQTTGGMSNGVRVLLALSASVIAYVWQEHSKSQQVVNGETDVKAVAEAVQVHGGS